MAFTGETKFGYVDGEHIGNWGEHYPVFVRVIGGVVHMVAREEGPGWIGQPNYMTMYSLGREWLKQSVFAAYPSDVDNFANDAHAVPDNSIPSVQFIKTSNSATLFKRPNLSATPTTPTTPDTPAPTDPVTTLPATTTNTTTTPAATTGQTVQATTKAALPVWAMVSVGLAGVGLIIGIAMWWMKRK